MLEENVDLFEYSWLEIAKRPINERLAYDLPLPTVHISVKGVEHVEGIV